MVSSRHTAWSFGARLRRIPLQDLPVEHLGYVDVARTVHRHPGEVVASTGGKCPRAPLHKLVSRARQLQDGEAAPCLAVPTQG